MTDKPNTGLTRRAALTAAGAATLSLMIPRPAGAQSGTMVSTVFGGVYEREYRKAIVDLVKSNERLGLNIRWASEVRKEIGQVYAAGRSTGFLPSDPTPATIFEKK